VGEDPSRVRKRRSGPRHAPEEDQGRGGRRSDGCRCVPAGQPDRAPARSQHRRAPGTVIRLQDHQAQQAAPQHRRVAPGHPRG
jgi:hypothetical protein